MEFIDKRIQDYAEKHSAAEPGYLSDLNRFTHTGMLKPRMLSGHLQGRFLALMSALIQPFHVLDIGTYTGYSALCLAEGLQSGGRLYTLDNNDEVMEVAKRYIQASPYADAITTITGEAPEQIRVLNQSVDHWDLVWMDADKADYMLYYELCIDKLRPGGLIMADNVLWSGKVTDADALAKDKDTAALHAFNTMVGKDERVEQVLLPVRDGILMIRKK